METWAAVAAVDDDDDNIVGLVVVDSGNCRRSTEFRFRPCSGGVPPVVIVMGGVGGDDVADDNDMTEPNEELLLSFNDG